MPKTRLDAEIARLQADIDKLMSERQGWLDEIEQLRRALEGTSHDPNAATVAALEEVERGGGKVYRGTSKQIIDAILDEGKICK
jgi:hypothetical protein